MNSILAHLHNAARDMAHDLGVSFHVAKVNGLWGLYAVTAPPSATEVKSFNPVDTGDGGAAHGRFSH